MIGLLRTGTSGRRGVPDSWKGEVGRCLESDPNLSIGLVHLERFWQDEIDKLGSGEDL